MIEGLLTKQEFIVMNLLWNSSDSLSLHEILEIEPEINRNTLQSVIRRLLSKNLIEVTGYGFHKTSLTRKISYVLSQADYFGKYMTTGSREELFSAYIPECTNEEFLRHVCEQAQQRLAQLEAQKQN